MRKQAMDNRHSFFYVLKKLFLPVIVLLMIFACACILPEKGQSMDYFLSLDLNIPDDSLLRLDETSQTVVLLKGENLCADISGDPAFAKLQSQKAYSSMAVAFLAAHHQLFKLNDPIRELKEESVTTDALGYTHIRLQQVFETVPVLNSEIIVHINQQNQVVSVNGRYIPTPSGLAVHPEISSQQAILQVEKDLKDTLSKGGQHTAELVIHAAADRKPRLAYLVKISSEKIVGSRFVVDAENGNLLTRQPTVYNQQPSSGGMIKEAD